MSRPRTPLAVLESRGSIKKNPQRYRERVAIAASAAPNVDIGDPPERWNAPADTWNGAKYARWKAIWYEFAPLIKSQTPMKRALLEMFCETMDRFRTNASGMKVSDRANLLQLIKQLEAEERGYGSSKNPEGTEGDWEAFG